MKKWHIVFSSISETGDIYCSKRKQFAVLEGKFSNESEAISEACGKTYINPNYLSAIKGRYSYCKGKPFGIIEGSATKFDLLYNGKVIKENQKADFLNSHKQSLISTGFYNKNKFSFSPRG